MHQKELEEFRGRQREWRKQGDMEEQKEGILIIEENTIYEIDIECQKCMEKMHKNVLS